jgi:hypothetical protein
VLGGVVFGGGIGGILGPIIAVFILQDHPHDPDAGRRRPQRDDHRGGHDHGRRGDVRRLPDDAREGPDMSDIHPQAEVEVRPLVRLGRFLKDNPVIPLIGLLFLI